MHACRWLLGLLVVAGCDRPMFGNWVEVDLAGTEETWNMYPDSCSRIDGYTVRLAEGGYDGASLTLSVAPESGARVGLVIPEPVDGQPLALSLGAGDACERFEVEVLDHEYSTSVQLELACDLPWISVWTSVSFTSCG